VEGMVGVLSEWSSFLGSSVVNSKGGKRGRRRIEKNAQNVEAQTGEQREYWIILDGLPIPSLRNQSKCAPAEQSARETFPLAVSG